MILLLASGDETAMGTNSDYSLPVDIKLDPGSEYECSLIDCSFSNPGATGNSVFISVDFIGQIPINNTYYNILYRTRPMTQEIVENEFSSGIYYEKEIGSIQQWKRIAKTNINNVRVQITQSTGEYVPNDKYSLIQLAIRKVQ